MSAFKYRLNDKLVFGKFRYKTLQCAIDTDPKYIDWLKNNAKNNFEMDEDSITYLIDKLVVNALVYVKNKINK